jgi:hypothetical protein
MSHSIEDLDYKLYKRKTPCYLAGAGCHDKEHIGWRRECGAGYHKWLLNFYRGPGVDNPNHYHCLYCGIADELTSNQAAGWPLGVFGLPREKVPKDWIEKLEQSEDDPRSFGRGY